MQTFNAIKIRTPLAHVWPYIAQVEGYHRWAFQNGPYPYLTEAKWQNDDPPEIGAEAHAILSDAQSITMRLEEWAEGGVVLWAWEVERTPIVARQWLGFELDMLDDGKHTAVYATAEWEFEGPIFQRLLAHWKTKENMGWMLLGLLENLKQLAESELRIDDER